MQFTHLLRKVHYEHGFLHRMEPVLQGGDTLGLGVPGSNWEASEGELLAHSHGPLALGFCWRLSLGAVVWVSASAASLPLMESEVVVGGKIDHGVGDQRTDLLPCSAGAQPSGMQDSTSLTL